MRRVCVYVRVSGGARCLLLFSRLLLATRTYGPTQKEQKIAIKGKRLPFTQSHAHTHLQVSPPMEHIWGVTSNGYKNPWWVRYQPVSYNINSRSGDETAFKSMCSRCKKVGVEIYADVVLNHMAGGSSSNKGYAGSSYNGWNFPEYTYNNFHHDCKLRLLFFSFIFVYLFWVFWSVYAAISLASAGAFRWRTFFFVCPVLLCSPISCLIISHHHIASARRFRLRKCCPHHLACMVHPHILLALTTFTLILLSLSLSFLYISAAK